MGRIYAAGVSGIEGFSQVGRVGVSGFVGELGERVRRRPDPRFGIGLAGVGMLMILAGIVAWAGDVAAESVSRPSESPDTTLGIIESLVIIAIGIVLLVRYRQGPLATAGVVASALGLPVFLAFVTFDPTIEDPDVLFLLPFNVDVIALFSVAAWLLAFVRLPYARGRTFYLAASAVFVWLYAVETVEEGAIGYLLTLPFSPIFLSFSEEFGGPQPPEPTNIGTVSLLFGLGYYALAVWLDRRGYRGSATPFLAVGAVTTVLGLGHLGGDLQPLGIGLVLIAAGAVLATYGANQQRRFTTWGWCLGIGSGVLLVITDFTEDNVAGFGIAAIVLGAGVIVLAQVLAARLKEPDEMWPGPSGLSFSALTTPRTPPPAVPWPSQPQQQPQPPYPGQPAPPPPPPPQWVQPPGLGVVDPDPPPDWRPPPPPPPPP